MNQKEIDTILEVHRLAFGEKEGEEIAKLAKDFLDQPDTISISATRDGKIAGNVLFTPFVFSRSPGNKVLPVGALWRITGVSRPWRWEGANGHQHRTPQIHRNRCGVRVGCSDLLS